jgi:hypothetical protein
MRGGVIEEEEHGGDHGLMLPTMMMIMMVLTPAGLDLLHPRERLAHLASSVSPAVLPRLRTVRSLGLTSATLLGAAILSGDWDDMGG